MIIAATAVVMRVRLPVLLQQSDGLCKHHIVARRVAQVAALQAGHKPTAVGVAFGRDRSTITGRPGRVDTVAVVHADTIAAILDRAEQFAGMDPDRVARIVDAVGRVALPPDIDGASRSIAAPVRVKGAHGETLLRIAS